jgi:hypothetical protein
MTDGGAGMTDRGAGMTDGGRKERREKVKLGDTPRPPAGSILHLFFK